MRTSINARQESLKNESAYEMEKWEAWLEAQWTVYYV